jgi:LPS export ABC transporter protein LptC
MTDKNNIITLWNKVELDRNTPPNKLNIKTSKLTLIVSKNLAHTDQSVVIINNSTHINATGMEAYLEENRTKFLSNVRVTHDQVKIN